MLGQDFADLTRRLESSRAEWRAEALRDLLTGLGNRPRLIADLEALLKDARESVAVLLIDLDGFKSVNDLLGHPAGDALLRDVATVLVSVVDESAQLYRLGGDEFAVVCRDADPAVCDRLAHRLATELRFVRHASGKPLSITACIGVATALPGGSVGLSELLARSDLALYEAKRAGRGTYRLFSPETHATYRETLALESGLRQALADARLEAWFQPIVDSRSGATLALEALARWHDPVQGWISPTRFIAMAEKSGQILDVDLTIFASALHAFAPMRTRHPGLRLHVNVSARSLAEPDFLPRLEQLLATSELPREAIALELTETDLSVEEHLHTVLERVRGLGLQLVVDDFGVGASSLGRLVQVRPIAVKIDGSFVLDIHGDGGRICRAIVELARELGMASVAEYVETDVHATLLAGMHCDALQGFGISPPLPAASMQRWLDDAEHRLRR